MAGSVVSDNFETSSGAIPQLGGANLTTRLCSAWVNFDGTGVVPIGDSFNVSSVVDTGVGSYTVNWLTDFASVNYAVAGHVFDSAANAVFCGSNTTSIQTVGAFSFRSYSYSGSIYDTERNSIIAFGDQ